MLQQNLFISAPTLSQIAATVALGERDYSEAQKAGYAARRRILNEGLASLGFGDVRESDGAFYSYVDVGRFTNDAMGFCKELLDVAGVAATPGIDFDRVNGQRFVRFSYAGSQETMETALERMRRLWPALTPAAVSQVLRLVAWSTAVAASGAIASIIR